MWIHGEARLNLRFEEPLLPYITQPGHHSETDASYPCFFTAVAASSRIHLQKDLQGDSAIQRATWSDLQVLTRVLAPILHTGACPFVDTWQGKTDCSNLPRVRCSDDNIVVDLDLSECGYHGSLPPQLALLTGLQVCMLAACLHGGMEPSIHL